MMLDWNFQRGEGSRGRGRGGGEPKKHPMGRDGEMTGISPLRRTGMVDAVVFIVVFHPPPFCAHLHGFFSGHCYLITGKMNPI